MHMLRKKAVSGFVFACVTLASASFAQARTDHSKWGEVGKWIILIDPNADNGCYMEQTFKDGTLVQIGFLPSRDGGFIALYNASWTDIEDGIVGTVQFDFEKSLFGGDYVGVVKGDLFGGYAFFNNPEFVTEFGRRNTVTIKADKGDTIDFSLSGTARAINAMRTCHSEQHGN